MSTDIHSLVGAYALDAVDDLERRAFERHLAECESCATEAQELRATAARLADSTWSVPPPRMRENVLAAIAATPQLAPKTRTPRQVRWRRPIAAAAVLVAIAGAGFTGYQIQSSHVRHETAAAEAARAEDMRIKGILTAPDLVTHSGTVQGGGRVTIASSRLWNAGVIVFTANAAPAGGRIYQLWTIKPGGAPVSAGVLAVGQSTKLQLVDRFAGTSEVGVTVERAPGARTPTLPMVADLKL